jgi:hypothetical protein
MTIHQIIQTIPIEFPAHSLKIIYVRFINLPINKSIRYLTQKIQGVSTKKVLKPLPFHQAGLYKIHGLFSNQTETSLSLEFCNDQQSYLHLLIC